MTTDHKLGFQWFIEERGLPFCGHAEFRKANLEAQQKPSRQLAMQIWSPEQLGQEAAS